MLWTIWQIGRISCEVFQGILGSTISAQILSLHVFLVRGFALLSHLFCKKLRFSYIYIFYLRLGYGFGLQRIWDVVIMRLQSVTRGTRGYLFFANPYHIKPGNWKTHMQISHVGQLYFNSSSYSRVHIRALFIYPAKSNFFVRLQIFLHAGCNFLQCVPQNKYSHFLPHLNFEIFLGFSSQLCSHEEGALVSKL